MRACLLMLPLVAAGAVTGVAAAAVQHEPAAAAAKPHLLYALVDDLGWYNVQLHNPKIRTPHFVELRSQGILLDRHYVSAMSSSSSSSSSRGSSSSSSSHQSAGLPVCRSECRPHIRLSFRLPS